MGGVAPRSQDLHGTEQEHEEGGDLVELIEDPAVPLGDALELAQELASPMDAVLALADAPERGAGTGEGSGAPDGRDGGCAASAGEDPRVPSLLTRMGWPDIGSAPRRALSVLVRAMDVQGVAVGDAVLDRYARPLAQIARDDIAALRDGSLWDESGGGDPGSADVVIARAVIGMVSFTHLANVLRALGHASYAILEARAR